MSKPADRSVSLAELRFKPANSNDSARAFFAHHFVDVPNCSFARDDGISHYLGSETGMEIFPASPDGAAPKNVDVPTIDSEAPAASATLRKRLLRGGFGLSIVLHAAAALAIGLATITLPDDVALEEGVMSVNFVVEGNADADARAAGAEEEVKEPEEAPLVETAAKPVEKEQTKPVERTTENILKDVPMPELGADLPDILSTQTEADVKTEAAAKPVAIKKKVELQPERQMPQIMPETVENKIEPKPIKEKPAEEKQDPKKKLEKKEPAPKRRQNEGNQGNQADNARRGDVDSDKKGKASTNSRGDVSKKETGDAARSNYKGLVYKKLKRTKGRIKSPARGNVEVVFTIMANGSISGLRVTVSSGKAAVDAAALKVVRSAAPFPAIPAEAGKSTWSMKVPMTFKGQ